MTAARQERKRSHAGIAALVATALALIAAPLGEDAVARERIVVDWHTGLAIGGYDPVAYYTAGKPVAGSRDFELRYGGAVWRFCNFGNRAAFVAHPDVYAPQFGGYDPIGVADGVAVAGNPTLWLISGEQLFLFYDGARLAAFAADTGRMIAQAQQKWPALLRTLSQ